MTAQLEILRGPGALRAALDYRLARLDIARFTPAFLIARQRPMKIFLPFRLVALVTLFAAPGRADTPFELREGDRVLFMGDTFFEREVDYGHIETRLTTAFPDRNVTFRNLSWAGDTPLGRAKTSFDWNKSEDDWLKRVKEQVALVKPTVTFLSYGMTAALDLAETKPEEQPAELEKFKHDLGRLMDAIEEMGEQKVRFVLVGPTANRPASSGSFPEVDADNAQRHKVQEVIAALATERNARLVSFQVPAGTLKYQVNPSAPRWSDDGVNLTELGNDFAAQHIVRDFSGGSLSVGPARAEDVLRSAIQKKNELFFHRWRPANWTYLFGFRKHEQGQNAVEIPKFDPLIAEWEARIAKLRDLKHQDAATVKEVKSLLADQPREHRDPNFKEQPVPTFEVADGFEVTLWAENPMLYKPVQMNWDAKGRLWVASSRVYPQIAPGQDAEDAVIVLEDTNGDGKAEKSTVFAEGLLIPSGVLPDNEGGCYVAASHQLLHFADKNRDAKADEKKIVLSSFGTEDTHHNLHTLRWGYDGHLYMNQSIYTHTHIETPHGVRRLNSAGIWRFNPDNWRLEVFTKGACNPWGHHWDQFGNDYFTDGAGGKGIYHAMEGATYFTYADMRREADSITPGAWPKFCSLELIRSPSFPADWQGDAITCDFRAHRVVRFKLAENGSTFLAKEMPDLLRSTNVTFRPIDLRMGPDGALYVADWSNPIIQHGEVDFRDPRRDHEHGRIWRVAAKAENRKQKAESRKRRDLTKLSVDKLLHLTLSANGWEQEQARSVLHGRWVSSSGSRKPSADEARQAFGVWKNTAEWAEKKGSERAKLEALWIYEGIGVAATALLESLLESSDANIRSAAVKALSHEISLWPKNRERQPIDLLSQAVQDSHPRVRVEALRALSHIPTGRSAELALSVLDKPMDANLDYALWLTINDLAEPWIAALQSGAWKPEGREKQLEFGLKALKAEQTSRVLGQLLASRPLARDGSGPWIEIIGAAGTPKELQQLFDQVLSGGFDEASAVRALKALGEAARLREQKPAGSLADVGRLLDVPAEGVRLEALKLGGEWKAFGDQLGKLGEVASSENSSVALRTAALTALRQIGKVATEVLLALTAEGKSGPVRREAVVALATVDLPQAVPRAIEMAKTTTDEALALELWRAVLAVKGAGQSLRDSLPEGSLSETVAKAGMKAAREGGRDDIELVAAFAKAGGLVADTSALSSEVMKELAAKAAASGDPFKGEFVFRRHDLACLTCHAIGGAGGKVGPDLTSIGASAQPDYLAEALLLPSAKIKEGYASVNIDTKEGQSFTGTLARETPDEVVLRNAQGEEVRIAKKNVEQRQNGTLSLMPGGLFDNLAEQERLDLLAFLSRLGKPGAFDASQGGVARRWRVYAITHTDQQNGQANRIWTQPLTDEMWQPAWSLASGKLTQAVLAEASRRDRWVSRLAVVAATELQVAKAGPVKLRLDASAGELWIDGRKIGGPGESVAELTTGTHRILLQLDPKRMPEAISLRTSDGAFLTN